MNKVVLTPFRWKLMIVCLVLGPGWVLGVFGYEVGHLAGWWH